MDAPVELRKPIRLQFGLQASPIRPLPPEDVTHIWQINGPSLEEELYRKSSEAGATAVVFHGGWKGGKGDDWGGWPSQPRDPERRKALKDAVALAHKHGLKVMIYTGWGVDATSDAWKHFGHEMIRKPIENSGFNTYRQAAGLQGAYNDYVAYALAELIRDYDVDGVLWDSTSNVFSDENLRIGNGWVDEKGNVRPAYPVRAARELYRRVYNLVHGELPPAGEPRLYGGKDNGVIVNHPGSIWAINVYSDVHHRGEGAPMHARTLRESWRPLEEYRAAYSARPFGLPYLGMIKNFKRLPMRVNNHLAVTLLHGAHAKGIASSFEDKLQNYGYDSQPHARIWQARKWLPFDAQTRWHVFYEGQKAVQPEPASLLASAFVSGDAKRALIVVSNLDKDPVPAARVRVDLKALGLNPAAPLALEDAILRQPVEFKDGAFAMDLEPERYRLLKLWQKE
ncbi:MAG: hypothetical protein FJ278_01575 [Planctomycetes bacterium]|nr:hypothetical protein [Planctomycetota bacterium]